MQPLGHGAKIHVVWIVGRRALVIGRHEGRHRSLTQHHANKDSKEEMGRGGGGGGGRGRAGNSECL